MKARVAALVLVGSLLALALQLGTTWRARVDATAAERYGRGLRSVLALELALSAEVMRAQSGLVGHFDGLVEIEARLRAQLAALHDAPRFLAAEARSELAHAVALAERRRRTSEERVETFKSEHAVLRNSLRFLPIAARALDAYQPADAEQARFKENAGALVRDVLLLRTVSDRSQVERVGARLQAMAQLERVVHAAGAELSLIVAHARVAHERAPHIAELVRELAQRPELRGAETNATRYEQFLAAARARASGNTAVSFALLLLAVLAAALTAILRLRQAATALRRTTFELEQAVSSLELEKEKQRELAELKSRFIPMTSHEIRTPLSTIMSSSELLEAYAERWPAAKKQEHFARIQSAVRGMLQMLDGVLMVGRSDAGKLEFKPAPIDLHDFCADAVERATQTCRGDHVLALEAPARDDVVVADAALLRQVVDNLLSNAVKYSPRGSKVRVRIARDRDDMLIEVCDEGI
ncbi:MAG TPA: DAHL domain-containing protein, partial [Polyangiales bacterium]|nr:DAHL domain-containing protein [Polyangiales bacterium]